MVTFVEAFEAKRTLIQAAILDQTELISDPREIIEHGEERKQLVFDAAYDVVAVNRTKNYRSLLQFSL